MDYFAENFVMDIILKELTKEAKLLEQYLQEEIAKYKASYTPIRYVRTGEWERSIHVSAPRIEGNSIIMEINFSDSVMHESAMGGEMGDVSSIMEIGVYWGRKFGISPNKFSNWNGTHYIRNAVNRFNKDNESGITLEVFIGEEKYI